MSRQSSSTPLLEPRDDTRGSTAPSPARDSLRNHLDQGLPLNKKRSGLFSTLTRYFRKPEEQHDTGRRPSDTPSDEWSTEGASAKVISKARFFTFTRDTTKRSRGPLEQIFQRPDDLVTTPDCRPERLSTSTFDDKKANHKRNISIASARDSIRTFTSRNRRHERRKSRLPAEIVAKPALDQAWQSEQNAKHSLDASATDGVPLPSSPIDIPMTAPVLDLDLGPAGFACPPAPKLTTTDNITTGLPVQRCTHLPMDLPDTAKLAEKLADKLAEPSPTRPADILRKTHGSFDSRQSTSSLHVAFEEASSNLMRPSKQPASRVPTPMPGTTFALELDGASSTKLPLFERSVETPEGSPEKRDQNLRSIGSLDALAKAYTRRDSAFDNDSTDALAEAAKLSHQLDEAAEQCSGTLNVSPTINKELRLEIDELRKFGVATERFGGPQQQLSTPSTPTRPDTYRDLSPATTVDSCPSDMKELSRQICNSAAGSTKHGDMSRWVMKTAAIHVWSDNKYLQWQVKNKPRAAPVVKSDPPPPVKQVVLPIRAKLGGATSKETPNGLWSPVPSASDGVVSDLGTAFDLGSKSTIKSRPSYEPIFFRPYLDRIAAKKLGIFRPGSCPSLRQKYSADRVPADNSIDVKGQTVRLVRASPSPKQQSPSDAPENQQSGKPQFVANDAESIVTNYDEYKTYQLFNINSLDSLADQQKHRARGSSSSRNSGTSVGPLMPSLYHAVAAGSQNSSPSRLRMTDVGQMFWLGYSDEEGHDADAATPRRRCPSSSIDDISLLTEAEEAPRCPATGAMDRIPSMGSHLDFDLARSERNRRYNSLQNMTKGHAREASARPASSDWTFMPPLCTPAEPKSPRRDSVRDISPHWSHSKTDSTTSWGSLAATIGLVDQVIEDACVDEPEAGSCIPTQLTPLPRSSTFDGTKDAIPTSSPMLLTKWEAENFQAAHPPSHYHPMLNSSGSGYDADRSSEGPETPMCVAPAVQARSARLGKSGMENENDG